MPIIDYEKRARKAEIRIMESSEIPDQTKRILQRFLTSYDVGQARRGIFLDKIQPLLKAFDPIEQALTDRDGINQLFADLRLRYSPATYATYINVVRRFLSWMNAGERPTSMCDIQPSKASKMKRDLSPEDMLTWEEGERLAAGACNVQLAAICLTQLDCGFRPSEFVELNYGDIQRHEDMAAIHVKRGKTGKRDVIAKRCPKALFRWMDSHPTQRPEDPLWISEGSISGSKETGNQVKRYAYDAIRKRIKQLGQKIGITRPLDFYSLRHSSCFLDKMDNLPTDLAAQRHGHSIKHYVETYGRLSVKDVIRRFSSHYGKAVEETPKTVPRKICASCHTEHSEDAKWCSQCGDSLTPIESQKTENQRELYTESLTSPVGDELSRVKAELAAARHKESEFRNEQLDMLRQIQEIKETVLQQRTHATGLIKN